MGPRYFEVVLSRTLLFCNEMPDTYEDFFIDGVNCVTFKNDLSDFEEKLDLYVKDDSKRESIIDNAYILASNNYTWRHLAVQLLNEIKNA
jgi:spore maturation protein CgeB